MSERVRYGRIKDTRVPKNTLVTIRKGDTVYFGIARCRLSADTFSKEDGVKRAKLRAAVAQDITVAFGKRSNNTLVIHQSGLFGQVEVIDISKLLTYFDNIDDLNRSYNK